MTYTIFITNLSELKQLIPNYTRFGAVKRAKLVAEYAETCKQYYKNLLVKRLQAEPELDTIVSKLYESYRQTGHQFNAMTIADIAVDQAIDSGVINKKQRTRNCNLNNIGYSVLLDQVENNLTVGEILDQAREDLTKAGELQWLATASASELKAELESI